MKHLALLRGINVGGNAKLPMKELATIFAVAGATDVRTLIQSGNVVFRAAQPEAVVAAVTAEIARVYGYPGRIVLRSADELRKAYAGNPFAKAGAAGETLHVYFLADSPDREAVKALDAERSPGDSFTVNGREIYLHLPQGMARTKLTNAYFDSKLKTVSTARNWNTVGKLVEMMTLGMLILLFTQGVAVAQGAMEAAPAPHPSVRVYRGRPSSPAQGFAKSPAKLCLADLPSHCYRLAPLHETAAEGGDVVQFAFSPRLERFDRPDGDLFLFYAHCGGWSGTAYRFALLSLDEAGKFSNLLPDLLLSNISDHALWSVPELTVMPLFVTADFDWQGMEAHYSRHHDFVTVYKYFEDAQVYRKILQYETRRTYPSVDFSDPREVHDSLLTAEKPAILMKLRGR